MNNSLGVSPSKGNQGTARGKENELLEIKMASNSITRITIPFICITGKRNARFTKKADRGGQKVRLGISFCRFTFSSNRVVVFRMLCRVAL